MTTKSIFERIIDREIKADIVYEDDRALAFRDVNPQAPTHVLIIPKRRIASLAAVTDADAALVGYLLVVARQVAEQLGLTGGFRLVANSGPDAGQTVDHLHFHLLGGRSLAWPPG
jgi:histidine triad (HIT) family protein